MPDRLHGQLAWKMKRLMNLKTHPEAQKELRIFVAWLSEISIETKRSMQEVGEELITVDLLGLHPRRSERCELQAAAGALASGL